MKKEKEVNTKIIKEEDFIPPDGGWGWMIVVAAGFSNLSALPVLQQFGLLFRDKFASLGITSSETTTIINMNSALTSCVGLANGPVFRKFTYRQVSLTGAIVIVLALLMTTFSYNFVTYLISFSILYGAGFGISGSANALALNTFWKKRRRIATGLSWTTTGLGPIVWPHIITALFALYGETGTMLVLSGFALHAIACAILLQPVQWHSKQPDNKIVEEETLIKENDNQKDKESGYFSRKLKNISAFSSQYLYNEDDPSNPGYEITDPGIPMLVRANDGYFSQSRQSRSRVSSRDASTRASRLNSKKPSMSNLLENRSRSSTLYLNESKKNSSANLNAMAEKGGSKKPQMTNLLDTRSRSSTLYSNESKKNSSANLNAMAEKGGSKKPQMTNLLENRSRKSSTLYLNESKKNSSANLNALAEKGKKERDDREVYKSKRKPVIEEVQILESEIEDCPTLKAPQDLKADEKAVVESIDPEKAKSIADRAEQHLTSNKSVKSFKMDGQYGEKYNKDNHSNVSFKNQDDYEDKKYLKDNHSNQSYRTKYRRKSNHFNFENELLKEASLRLEQYLKDNENNEQREKIKLLINGPLDDNDEEDDEEQQENVIEEKLSFGQKLAMFFDLDLLKDFTFINLMLGITLANFNELNFSILTPFILGDYGLSKPQVALFMSLLAGVDICVRFCVPMIAGKIGWENNSFFLFGVMSMALGRVVLAYCQQYNVILLVAVIIGFGKGLRTVFMALVIPTHVPLHKLPGASGIQLLTAGVVYLSLGPFVGWIKDNASTAVTLHCLNIFTWLTALSWGLEKYFALRKLKKKEENINA